MRFAVNTFSSFKLKSYKLPHIILTAFLFFNAAHSYAASYTWTGPFTGDWHTAANWSPTGIPTINDDVTVSGGVSISAGDAEAKMLTIQNGLVELENVTLKVETLLCIGVGSFKGAGDTGNGTGTLKFIGSASFSTGSTLCTFANIEVDTGAVLTLGNSITVKRNFINNGAVTTATGNLTINGNYSGAGSLSASSITINFKGDVDFSQGTFSGTSRTVKLNGTAPQKIKINAPDTDFGNLEINKTSGDVTVEASEGTLSAASLKITSAPGGVTVNAPLSVTGILEHTGGGNALFTKRVTAQTLRHSGIGTADFSEEVVTPNLEHTGTNTLTFQKKIQIAASFTDNTSSGALNLNGGADFTFTSQTEFKTAQTLTLAGNCSFGGGMKRSGSGATNISGKITTADKAIYFLSSNNVTLTDETVMETGSGNITFDEKVLGAPKKLEIKTSGTAKFNKGFDNNFALHLTGKAEIKEDNTFSSFKVDNSSIAAATSVNFEGGSTQTINNSISLKGNAVSKPLTLGSTNSTKWNVYFSSVPTYEDFSYVVVDKSKSVDSGGNAHKLNLSQSDDYVKDSNYSLATTENWFSTDFYWKGTADSNWANAANWAYPDGNPRNHVPAHIGSTADVTIDTAAGGNDLELGNGIGSPLTTALSLKSLTVNAHKRIGLGKCKISAADKIENKGTIALYGNQTATLPPVLSSPDTAHLPTSAIEYYGAENGSDVLAITMPTPPVYTYKKLIVKKSAGKTMTFNNGISADSFDASVNAGKIIFNNGTVTTTGEQKYAGALELGADVTFTASKITFSATVDGSKALTIAGSAPTEFNKDVGGTAPLTTLTTGTGLTTINTSSIKTSGSQTYNGKLELGANAKIQTVNAASVTFEETVNSASAGTNEFSLTIEGAAKPEFKKDVGLGTKGLAALTTDTNTEAVINTSNIKTSGTQTYKGKVTLSKNTTLTAPASNIKFDGTVDGPQSLTIAGNAAVEFNNPVGSATSLAALTTGTGLTTINTSSIKTSGSQTYNGKLELGANAKIQTVNAASVTFEETVNSASAGTNEFSLTIEGAAKPEFKKDVGLGTKGLAALTTDTNTEAVINTSNIKTSGTQTYKGKVTLSKNTTLTAPASNIKFDGTVDGPQSLTIAGNAAVEFNNPVGSATSLAALTTGTGLTTINTSSIKTSGSQTYNGKLELGANAKIQTVNAASVTFEETVNSASAGTNEFSLTIEGAAKPEFKKDVGLGTKGLAALTTDTNTEAVINTSNIKTSGTQTYKGKVTLSKNTTLTAPASNIKFDGTVDGPQSLTIAGNAAVEFNNPVGSATSLAALTTGTGLTTINTSSIKTNGIQTYKGKVILNTDSTLDSGSLMFEDAINSAANGLSGAKDLTLLCAGVQTFKKDIGNVHPLKSFTSGTGDIVLQCSSIKTRAAQTYKGKLKLEHDVSLVSTAEAGGVILFESSVEDNASHSLSVETGNDYIAFRLPLSMTGAKIQTGGSQTFKAAKGLRLLSESDFTWSAGGSGINLEPNTTDLYTDCAAAVKVTLASDLSCRNFYFYKGKFSAGSSKITSTKDFAVWGSNYNADDPRFSGTDTRFEFYTQLPLDYPVPTSKGAAFENLAGTQFIVGGNFYINGTDLNASSLALTLPDNTSSKPVFNPNAAVTERQWGLPYAAAFNMSAANVTASRWIAAGGAQIQNVIDGGGNTNWQFDMPKIVDAYTVYDDVVYVKFNMDLENSNGEIATNLALAAAPGATLPSGGVWYNGGTLAMLGAYSDSDCSSPIVNGDIPAAQGLYIKTNGGKWNTDATGTEAYGTDSTTTLDSTDRSGVHRNVKTDLSFLEGIFTAANGHTMCRNYGIGLEGGTSAPSYTNVSDKCAPVLIEVYTGQEQHTAPDGTASMTNYDADSQKPYDAHNFIEFRYSEPVDTGALKLIDKTIDAKQINIKATGTFGAINNSSSSPKLSIEGIAKIANGSLQTGSLGNADNLVHSLYRKFSRTPGAVPAFESHRLRVAISGYADTVVSDGVKSYYNWQGYIDSAESPSGRITRVSDNKIKDKAGNTPDSTGTANHTLAQLSVESADDGLYGKWDVLPPVFASFMHRVRSDITGYEALGTANPGSTTLERLEFHLFDNAENDSDWYIKLGWSNDGGNNLVVSDAYGADIFGGSKPFTIPASGRTSGGIRYSSVYGKSSSFKYGIGAGSAATTSFAPGNIKAGAQSLVFSPYTTPRHSSTQTDGLYISIDLPALSQLPFNTIFSVKYDESGFVTDLAGNRMKTSTITTIDRSPPGFNMTVAAVKDPASSAEVFKELYVVFNKKLELNLIPIYDSLGTATAVNALEKIPACLRFIDSSTLNSISTPSTPADKRLTVESVREKFSNSNYTGLILKLNRTLTLEDIKSTYLQCYVESADKSTDPLSGIPNTYVSYIQDHLGNYLPNFSAHPISDFAVNVVQPVYAYDDRYAGTGGSDMTEIFDSSVAAYDWNEEQRKLGTLIMEHDIFIYAKFNDGAQQTPASVNVNAYFDLVSQLTPGAVSVNYNKNTSDVSDWRVWLPNKNFNIAVTAFSALSPELNDINKTSVITLSDPAKYKYRGDNKPLIFNLPYKGGTSISTAGWSSGDQISFLFGLANTSNTPIKIRHNPVWDEHTSTYTGEESPLFALRLKNPSDITSVDLWSFKMQKQKSQRGGVTVLNNVINALKAEKMTLQVDMPSAGSLNVIIMTLDGDIVKYLHHGQAESGSHYFTWDGTTKNGGLTARGLYFIRVFGNGIDETRKVMVVKD